MSKTLSDFGFRLSIGGPLLLVAVGAWAFSAYQLQAQSTAGPATPSIPLVSMAGMFTLTDPGMFLSFVVVWVVGMVAMMFPAMVPVVSMYSRMMVKGEERPRLSLLFGTPLFLAGYLSVYGLLGVALFAGVYAVFQMGSAIPSLSALAVPGLALVLLLAGAWQLTPLKEKSLAKCVTPMGFFMTHAKKGFSGAFRMGAEHGVYCVGCCWLYMVVMLVVGAMSLLAMGLLSVLIIVEKAFVGNAAWFKWLTAGIFFLLAGLVLVFPSFLSAV